MQANLQKDTTLTKIFVGGLPYHTTDESLRVFFAKFGEIEEAVVITDRTTGKSRGYGFVTMVQKESAEDAVRDPNPIIDGRRANVNLAYLGAKNRSMTMPLGYSLLARMPTTYQTAGTAYPSTNLFYYPLTGQQQQQQQQQQQAIYLNPFSQLNLANLSAMTNSSNAVPATSTTPALYEFPPTTTLFDTSTSNGSTLAPQQIYWPNYN